MASSSHHSITLPTVLKEYSPEYDLQTVLSPKSTTPSGKLFLTPDISDGKSNPPSRQTSRSFQKSPSRQGIEPERSVSPEMKERRKKRVQDAERYEKLSLKWDQAKEEVRQDDYEVLKEKVQLQQQLIRRQDELANQRRQQSDEEEKQKRDLKKQKKREMEAALQKKCKESIEEDRKTSPKRHSPSKDSKSQSKSSSVTSSVHMTPQRSPASKTRVGSFQPSLPPLSRTPTNAEILEREGSWSMPNPQELERHQLQLYQMFGKGADDFLHPKIEPVAKKSVNSKLRKQGGRAGAQRLWTTLRKESYVRLLKEDAHIPTELKETYSAFIRESIDKERQPIKRFFCAKEDVPELGRLQDQSTLVKVRNLKHKVDLMYRASKNNEDRTEILVTNNQLPAVALSQEEADVNRYLPSWMDNWSDSTAPEYTKWIRDPTMDRDIVKETIHEEVEADKENKKYADYDDTFILLMTRKKHQQPKPNYVFLTERDSRVRGKFTDKFKDQFDNQHLPKPFEGPKMPAEKAKSVMGLASDVTFASDLPTRRSAPIPERHRKQFVEYRSQWQPLSMNALIEYKKKMEVEGEGQFNQGRPKMWATEVQVS